MIFQIPSWLEYFSAWFMFMSMIYGALVVPEKMLRTDTRRKIGLWLGGTDSNAEHLLDPRWTSRFIEFFDALFVPHKRRHRAFPLPGLIRSAFISLIFTVALTLFYGSLDLIELDPLRVAFGWGTFIPEHQRLAVLVIFFVFFFMTINFVADYISIIETRYFIHRIRRGEGHPVTLIFCDLLCTILISFLSFSASFLLLFAAAQASMHLWIPLETQSHLSSALDELFSLSDLPNIFVSATVEPKTATYAGLFTVSIHATFLTSLWLLLYISAGTVSRFAIRLNALRQFLERHFLLEERPLTIMAFPLFALSTVLLLVFVAMSVIVGDG